VFECRAVSLTRDIPEKFIIYPIVRTLTEESLISTLEATGRALLSSSAKQKPT